MPIREKSSSRVTRSAERPALVLLLALTFSTGMVDAIGFLGLDSIFAGNMTGNVVIIGMSMGGGDLPVVGPALALAGFMGGAACAGAALHRARSGWTSLTTACFAVTGGILAASGAALLATPSTPAVAEVVSFALGAAMGVQAAAARIVAVADVTTVVITSTLVGLAADQFSAGRRGRQVRRALAVVVMLMGAAAGAALLQAHIGVALLVCGGLTCLTVAVALVGRTGVRDGDADPSAQRPAA